MDREAQPEPPESEPEAGANPAESTPESTPETEAAAPPAEPPEPPVSGTDQPKPRTPVAVLAAVVVLWLFAVVTAWTATVSVVATSFEVTARYSDAWTPLEFVESLLILAAAVVFGLLAIKVRSGRDWARSVVVIVSAIALAAALLTRAFAAGTGAVGTAMLALLLVLLLLRPARDWCDCDAERHSPRIAKAAQPPHQVVSALLVLWTAVGTGLYLGSVGILAQAGDEVDLASDGAAWTAGAIFVLAIIHAALNIGFSFHRNWARWATVGLAAAYAFWLIIAATRDLFEDGTSSWPLLVILCLIPLALIWAMAGADSREWCRRAAPDDQNEAEN
ncbi:hypothetical protein [Glycomyces rhizosphaerae]|uniref:Uncharacterized protein n=1 Tax=Glycomyces rhizosphaerae TaxID=2054422 RepID=A0ABV7PZX3_9ACTN